MVGPLARLNMCSELKIPSAEGERQLLIEALGPFPHFGVVAAYRALVVELVEAAGRLVELYEQGRLTGPAIRTIPTDKDREGMAALESPQGLIAHRYRIDDQGMVEDIDILDTAAQNNALRCMLTARVVEAGLAGNRDLREIKTMIELSLLPF